jgi:protein O-mannosyl-transferase
VLIRQIRVIRVLFPVYLSMTENKSNFFQTNAELIVLVGLVSMCIAVFGQVVGFQFVNFDDNFYVYENSYVLGGLNQDSMRWALTAFHSANWHPLTWLSHMADVSLFGKNAGAHHATNLVLHIVNSFLAFVVFRKMTGCFWKSAMVAALFAVHPAHVESVAWVSERKDVLSTLFWLLTMLVYFRYADFQRKDAKTQRRREKKAKGKTEVQNSKVKGQRIYYFLTILLFALGLTAKPMLVTLPFVLLLCDYWSLERWKALRDLKPLVIEKLPLFALSAISAYVTILAQKSFGAVQTLQMLPLPTRLLNAVVAYAKYVATFFYPVNLGVTYPYQESFPLWQTLGSLALLIAITALCIRQRRERKYLLMGWLWFLGTLVPVIGVVQVGSQSMADRYTYVPFFGLFVMIVWGAWEIFLRLGLNRMIVAAMVGVVLLALSFLCFKQVSHWQNAETLYSHTLGVGQGNFIIKHNFCNYLLRENRLDEAERLCRASIDENPNFVDSYTTLGVVYARKQNLEAAVQNFKKSLEIDPNNPTVYTNLAAPLAMLGRTEEAEQNIDKAADIYRRAGAPPSILNNAYTNLAAAYAAQQKFEKSSEILSRVLQITPENVEVRLNYALSLYFQEKLDEAKQQVERIIRQNRLYAESYNLLGLILVKQNKRDEAAKQFEKALELKPDLAEAKENLKEIKGEK